MVYFLQHYTHYIEKGPQEINELGRNSMSQEAEVEIKGLRIFRMETLHQGPVASVSTRKVDDAVASKETAWLTEHIQLLVAAPQFRIYSSSCIHGIILSFDTIVDFRETKVNNSPLHIIGSVVGEVHIPDHLARIQTIYHESGRRSSSCTSI